MAAIDQSTRDQPTAEGAGTAPAPNGNGRARSGGGVRTERRRVLHSHNHGRVPPSTHEQPPELAPGVELVGEFEGSGFKQPPMIARRPDGQAVQLPPLLYAVAEKIDGERDHEQIAQAASDDAGRELHAEDVKLIVDEKLCP